MVDRRSGRAVVVGGLVLALAVLVVAVVVVLAGQDRPIGYQGEPGSLSLAEVDGPAAADDDGGIPLGSELVAGTVNEGAAVVEVVFDYRCPWCAEFEKIHGPELEALAEEGTVTLVLRPVSFLDERAEGSRQYSTRSATAAAVVADRAPEHFLAFHLALMQNQPGKGEGPSDADIAAVARQAGVPEDVVAALDGTRDGGERLFARWVFAATERADEILGGLTTPSVLVDGQVLDLEPLFGTPGAVRAAVEDLL